MACTSLLLGATSTARTATPKSYVDAKTRNIIGGRKVLVVIPQDSIAASFENLNLKAGGMVVALIGVKLNQLRAADARALVATLATALADYDFDASLYAGLKPTIEGSPWLRGQDLELTHAGDTASIELELNESNTRQMLMLRGWYYVDFHEQRMIVELQASMLIRRIPKGQYSEARLKSDYIPYQQTFRSISYLPQGEGVEPAVNFARWADDDGKLARRALDRGIARISAMFAANLDADKATVELWRRRGDRKTIERFGLLGWVVGREASAVQFVEARSGALNDIATLSAD